MLARVASLRELRLALCPRVLDEDLFWAIYFLLTKQHLRALRLQDEVDLSSEEDQNLHQQQQQSLRVSIKAGKRDWKEVLQENTTKGIYKCILQQGCPPELQKQVLMRLLVASDASEPPLLLEESYARLFGKAELVPKSVLKIPLFGSLDAEPSQASVRRVLCALALSSGHVYAPQLVALLVVLCEAGFDEASMLEAGQQLLRHALDTPVTSTAALSSVLLLARPIHVDFAVSALARLVQLNFPRVHSRMNHLKVSVSSFAAAWYCSFFSGMVPLVMRKIHFAFPTS